MLTFYNEHHALQPVCGEAAPGDGQPDAVALTLAEFERRGLGRIVTPQGVPLVSLERVHTPRYLHFLRTAWNTWSALDASQSGKPLLPALWPPQGVPTAPAAPEPEDFLARLGLFATDSRTPIAAGTWTAARTGADCAINAGHAGEQGVDARLGATMNLPLSPDCGSGAWFAALETACVKLAMFRPEALVISLGGLAPGFGLQGAGLLRIGERIAHLGLPTAFLFEGSLSQGAATVNILEGFETAA